MMHTSPSRHPGRSAALRVPSRALLLACAALATAGPLAVPARAAAPRVHAITNARLVTAPGQVIPRGTIVMRDGLITAVGPDVAVPKDARVWPGDSLTVYAGLIDAFVVPAETGGPSGPAGPGSGGFRGAPLTAAPRRGAGHELSSVTPELRMVESAPLAKDQVEALRAAGFAVAQVAPRRGVLRGQSLVMGLGGDDLNANVIEADVAQVVALEPVLDGYPGSLMGAIAVVRQALSDAKWYRDALALYAKRPQGRERPEENLAWAALEPVVSGRQPALIVASDMLEVLRAGAVAKEAAIAAQVVGAGDEYKRVREVAAAGLPLIVPVNFPDAPDVSDSANALEVSTEELRHWDQAPGNAAALRRAGVQLALTANGMKDVKGFRAGVARAVRRGLTADDALAAVTTVPAKLLGLSERLGTLAPGRIADLTVMRGDLFSDRGRVREVWVDGNRYEVSKPGDEATGAGAGGASAVGDSLRSGAPFVAPGAGMAGAKPGASGDAPVPTPVVMGDPEAWRSPEPAQPAAVLVRNATIWTSGPQGVLEGADLLVRAGRIAAVGRGLAAPAGAVVIDGTGRSVSPGIIDGHSHTAILGNVNECTHSVTAEVRIQDVINSESISLYRELAGGVTLFQALHGSCNAIGGQAAVVKNRWGAPPEGLLYPAPPTLKMALGENPKQSGDTPAGPFGGGGRYPKTRGGVEQVIRDAFSRARDYREAQAEWKAGRRSYPPRRDLQLDALVEVLDGRRFVHPHSYRQDEILMMMRVAEEFGFQVGTFQHVLEGYKVADEMAAHGAGGSTFSDWWAYKQEVLDAIPYNGYLMWDRGVTVSYNSDSDELARRLNTEAAKAVKYGGVPREVALGFVTLNPAKQLGIEDRVGSLEPGKDADFAIWSGSPLSPFSLCEQTWIDGRRYFDRNADLAGRAALAEERAALIAKAKAAKQEGGGPAGGRPWPPRYLEETDMSGNLCGHGDRERQFLSEAMRRALQGGGIQAGGVQR